MSITFIFIIFILFLYFFLFRNKKYCLSIICILIFTIFFIGSGILPAFLMNTLESPDLSILKTSYGKKNAIVVLGAGMKKSKSGLIKPSMIAYSRISEATRLYYMCKKTNSICTIIISGGDPHVIGKSEADVYQDLFIETGVQNSDILLEDRSKNTYQNAQFTSSILKEKKFDKIFLVTSGFHMKRASLYFSHFGIYAVPVVSDYLGPIFSIIPIGYNFCITDFALSEQVGIIRFYIYNFLGLNKK